MWSYDSHNSQVEKCRQHEKTIVYVKELEKFLTMKVPENTPAVLSLGKLCNENRYSYGQQTTSFLKRDSNRSWFTGLSSSSSSSSHSSTSMTLSRQERNHPTSSSSSSTLPTTTVLSDSETREREELSGIDSHPAPVSSSHVERNRTERPVVAQANQKSKTK